MKEVIGVIALVLAALVVFDEPTERAERESYCELVAMWEADEAKGKDVYSRDGHPNYNQVECDAVLAKADGEQHG